jgi:DNA-binding NarL/FixJ family response regulator
VEQTDSPGRDQERIILYGDALFIQSVEACVRGTGEVGLVGLCSSALDAPQRLQSLRPDLVVMDLRGDQSHLAVSLLREQPGVSILCVDQERQEAIVLCGQSYPTPSAEDLTEIIRRHVKGGALGRQPDQGEWDTNRPLSDAMLTDLVPKEEEPQ